MINVVPVKEFFRRPVVIKFESFHRQRSFRQDPGQNVFDM